MVYPALLPLMRTTRLPVVDWTDAPAYLNGLVLFAERRNLLSACVPSRFKRSLIRNRFTVFYRQPYYNICKGIQFSKTTTKSLKPEIPQNTNKCKRNLLFNLTCMHWPKFNKPQHSNNLQLKHNIFRKFAPSVEQSVVMWSASIRAPKKKKRSG